VPRKTREKAINGIPVSIKLSYTPYPRWVSHLKPDTFPESYAEMQREFRALNDYYAANKGSASLVMIEIGARKGTREN